MLLQYAYHSYGIHYCIGVVSNVLSINTSYSKEPQNVMEVKNLRLKEMTRLPMARKNFWLLQKDFTKRLPLSNLLVM